MKIAIIGASGHWAYALEELKNHTVVGICAGYDGEDISSVKNTLDSKGISYKCFGTFSEVLAEKPEVAIVNTRFDLNGYFVKEFLARDIYVFAEKPLAISEKVLEEIKNTKTKAFVSCMFGISYEGWCLTVKEAVKNIGTVRMINGRKSYKLGTRPDFYKDKKTFGGILPWVGIHAMHWIYFVTGLKFGKVCSLTSNIENRSHGDLETCAATVFLMENGAISTVTADYYRPETAKTWDDDRIRIVGTEGVVEYEKGKVFIIDKDGERELELLPTQDIFKLFIERVNGKDCGVSMEESIYITEVALKSENSVF